MHDVARVSIAGVEISAVTLEDVMSILVDAPANGDRVAAHFCTAHTIVEASHNATLRDAINRANLPVADGVPLVWAGRVAGARIGRVCGLDVMPSLLDRSRATGRSHFFYGSAPGVAERLAERMSARYPGVKIAGVISPPFRPLTDAEDREYVDRINASGADYVWVGLGTPKQDLWIAEHRCRLSAAALLAVGAAFEVHSGMRHRAPRFMQRTGLEWFYRLIQEPRRLLWRYTVVNGRFVALAGPEAIRRARRR